MKFHPSTSNQLHWKIRRVFLPFIS